MKKYLLILIIIFELVTIKIPEYVELNNIAIIEEVAVIKTADRYTVILKEVIPKKDDNGITYEYKFYEKTAPTVEKAYNYIKNSAKRKIYIERVKSLITNCKTSKDIINSLEISPKTITHTTKDIEKIIKK